MVFCDDALQPALCRLLGMPHLDVQLVKLCHSQVQIHEGAAPLVLRQQNPAGWLRAGSWVL